MSRGKKGGVDVELFGARKKVLTFNKNLKRNGVVTLHPRRGKGKTRILIVEREEKGVVFFEL